MNEIGFPRPIGMNARIFEDEIGKYVCVTEECSDDVRRQAGLLPPSSRIAIGLIDGFASGIIPDPRKWLMLGGGGHEDGADGIRAMTAAGERVVELLEAYRDDILTKARTVSSYGKKKAG